MKVLNADVMQGFVKSVLSKRFDGAVDSPKCHVEWWDLCTSTSPYIAIAAPRGFAKSTAITFSFTLATILFRERKFVLVVSDTEAQAMMFVGMIKQEIEENEDIQKLFKFKKNDKGKVAFLKESEGDLIGEFADGAKFRIIAKGSEQKLRGLLWNGLRPDLIVCDDMENDEIVMNQDRRKKFHRWFYGALLPCRAKHGIVRYVGTILHMDSMLEKFMPSESDKQTFVDGLKTYSTRRTAWKGVKYKAHNEDFTKLLWEGRRNAEWLQNEREDYRRQGLSDVYSQEYLNVPIDESLSLLKKGDFMKMSEDDRKKLMNFYITVDLAIGDKQRSDYSVFLVAGVDEEKKLNIVNVIRERLDGKEIVDTLLALQRTYKPIAIGIEETQISKSIGPFLNEAMVQQNEFIDLYALKHMGVDKVARSRSIQARMRAKSVKFDKDADWYVTFEDECVRFPRDKHDDQVDAFAYLGLMLDKLLEAPTVKELADEEYGNLYRQSGLANAGQSTVTGY